MNNWGENWYRQFLYMKLDWLYIVNCSTGADPELCQALETSGRVGEWGRCQNYVESSCGVLSHQCWGQYSHQWLVYFQFTYFTLWVGSAWNPTVMKIFTLFMCILYLTKYFSRFWCSQEFISMSKDFSLHQTIVQIFLFHMHGFTYNICSV